MKWLELKVPPLLVVLIFGTLTWVIRIPYKVDNVIFKYGVSCLLFVLGSIVLILGVLEFRKQKATVNPMNPKKSNNLVVKGIYKYTRNPMYLGFLFWLVSFGLFVENFLSSFLILGFVFYMNYFQILPEERILVEKFEEDYLKYKTSVRRWI